MNYKSELDIRTISYRLWRLRRLIGVAVALPLPALIFTQIFGFGLTLTGAGGVLWLLWIPVVLALALRFPNGWIDHFALGLPLFAIILLSPFAVLFGVGPIGGLPLGALVMVIGWFWINSTLPTILSSLPMGTQKRSFRKHLSLPVATVRDAFFLRPDARCGLHACGPKAPDDSFEVRAFGYQMLDDSFRAEPNDIAFRAKVVESDETTQITQYFLTEGALTASTTYEEITPARKGCVYAKEEVHDHFDLFAAIGLWINDVEADHMTATLDFVAETPPRALKLMPQDSLLTWLAQRFVDRIVRDDAA